MLKLLFQNCRWYNSLLLQLLEQEIDGVALFLEVQLLQNHVQLCIYSQLFRIWLHSIVVSVICSWLLMPPSFFSSFARREGFHGEDGPDNFICIKSRRERGFRPLRVFPRWIYLFATASTGVCSLMNVQRCPKSCDNCNCVAWDICQ